MPTLDQVIDYTTAPLVQWEPVIGAPMSEGKALEDQIIHAAVIKELSALNVTSVTGFVADEARLELQVAHDVPSATNINHLTLTGAFEIAARKNVAEDVRYGDKVRVVSNIDDIPEGSQDAVMMSMIVGCVATPESHNNIRQLFNLAAGYLKDGGHLVLVRPNAEVGEATTYSCLTPHEELKAGGNYQFMVKGLEEYGVMNNLYTPDSFLNPLLKEQGFEMGPTQNVMDPAMKAKDANAKPAFLMNVCKISKAPKIT